MGRSDSVWWPVFDDKYSTVTHICTISGPGDVYQIEETECPYCGGRPGDCAPWCRDGGEPWDTNKGGNDDGDDGEH